MEGLELDENNHCVLWRLETKQAQENALEWHMLEHNEIAGFLPFDYFYVDNQVCFRYTYHSLQRIEEFVQKKSVDFESLLFLCAEILDILERGREYLLGDEGYLLLPEWIFWNRYEKKVFLCYLPGKKGNISEEYTALIEYLMRCTDHSDTRAVSLIYGLYDLLTSNGFIPEALSVYLQKMNSEEREKLSPKKKECPVKLENIESEGDTDTLAEYCLKPLSANRTGRFHQEILHGDKEREYSLKQGELVVGREKGSDLFLPFATVSRHHAMISWGMDGFCLTDTASTNGTYVNGNKISAYVQTPCKESDIITFADISYQLCRMSC